MSWFLQRRLRQAPNGSHFLSVFVKSMNVLGPTRAIQTSPRRSGKNKASAFAASFADLLAEVRECLAHVREGWIVDDVPVEDIKLVHCHRFLELGREEGGKCVVFFEKSPA